MNNQKVTINTLQILEKQYILRCRIEDTQYGSALKINTKTYQLTTRINIDLFSSLTTEELNSITAFYKADKYNIIWEGNDENVIKRLNFVKPLLKIKEVTPYKIHTVTNITDVNSKYGPKLLVETDDFKVFYNNSMNFIRSYFFYFKQRFYKI